MYFLSPLFFGGKVYNSRSDLNLKMQIRFFNNIDPYSMCKLGGMLTETCLQLHRRCAPRPAQGLLEPAPRLQEELLLEERTSLEEGIVQMSLTGTREQNMLQNRKLVIEMQITNRLMTLQRTMDVCS